MITKKSISVLLFGLVIGVSIGFAGSILAQTADPSFKINSLFSSDTLSEKEYIGISETERNFTLLYGKLEYMQKQLNQVIDTCALR